MSTTANKELFRRIASGDESAFRQLFDAYTPKLSTFFRRWSRVEAVVPELVQETFLRIWVHRIRLIDVEDPEAYLYKVAANVSAAWFRKAESERKMLKEITPAAEAAEDTQIHLREIQRHIAQAIHELPQQQQQVYKLSREAGLSRAEIASTMNLSESTVKNYLTLALASLQAYLKSHHNIYLPFILLQAICFC